VLEALDGCAGTFPPPVNAGQLAAAAASKALALGRQLVDAEAEVASLEFIANVTERERTGLAADVRVLRQSRAAAVAERDAHATALKRVLVEFPEEWTAQHDDGGDRAAFEWWQGGRTLVLLGSADAKWRWAEEELQRSLPTARLTRLERWEDRLQFRDYWTKRRNVGIKRDGDANEQWLWHGTRGSMPATTLQHEVGLDPRFSSQGFYGHGLYLAEKARYANAGYVHCPNHPDTTTRQILLVRAAVGLPHDFGTHVDRDKGNEKGTRHLKKPPEESPGKLYDSVKGGPHRPRKTGPGENDSCMVVLYDLAQAYPEYILTYTV